MPEKATGVLLQGDPKGTSMAATTDLVFMVLISRSIWILRTASGQEKMPQSVTGISLALCRWPVEDMGSCDMWALYLVSLPLSQGRAKFHHVPCKVIHHVILCPMDAEYSSRQSHPLLKTFLLSSVFPLSPLDLWASWMALTTFCLVLPYTQASSPPQTTPKGWQATSLLPPEQRLEWHICHHVDGTDV